MVETNVDISVIIGVYNAEETLQEALDSILSQKNVKLEIVICDDGSTDNSYNLLQEYKKNNENKIVLLMNDKNMGLNYTLNKCLQHSSGRYIARMDADDLSLENRLYEQFNFLENNRKYSIVSSQMLYFDSKGVYGKSKPVEYPNKLTFMNETTPFAHAAAMVRSEAYQAVSGYTVDKRLVRVEDFHLWLKMYIKGYLGYNMQIPLYMMRNDTSAIDRRKFKYRINETYVRCMAVKDLKLPKKYYIKSLLPVAKGLTPKFIYKQIHLRNLKKRV